MASKLEQEKTWPELCEYTLSKIRHNLRKGEEAIFKKWFMAREKVGYCFDEIMILRCFRIWQELQKGLDHFVVCTGREGLGKSTFSFQLAAWVNPDGFSLENICYGAKSYLDIMGAKAEQGVLNKDIKSESLVLDEGTELLSRETMNVTNRTLGKTFFIQRALKFLVVVNIPNFFMLDNVIRLHRVRTLILITDRGKYKAITGRAIPKICKEGKLTKDINSVKLPNGFFWNGYFNKEFPKNIDRAEYEDYKMQSIRDTIETMKDDVVSRKMIAASKVAKELGLTQETVLKLIKKGEIEGKMIGGKYYITRKAYDKLTTA